MIRDNLIKIRKKIAQAAERSGRSPEKVDLLAVSKRVDIKRIQEAFQSGQYIFGENYLQEAQEKIKQLDSKIFWHFIGHLQSNKAKLAAQLFQMIETVDRLKIARALNKHAEELDKILDILVQINIGEEKQKSGVLPQDAENLIKDLRDLKNIRVRGLMTIPPFVADPEETRPFFKSLKKMADRFNDQGYFANSDNVVLSMGMSDDFMIAVEEGSTLVRVGTAIFGARN